MTAAVLALFLAGTHACRPAGPWTVTGQDLVAGVVCLPPAGTWPVGRPIIRIVKLTDARAWPAGSPCTAYIRNGKVVSGSDGNLRSRDGLTVCVPGGGS